jgi:hypothetical protein
MTTEGDRSAIPRPCERPGLLSWFLFVRSLLDALTLPFICFVSSTPLWGYMQGYTMDKKSMWRWHPRKLVRSVRVHFPARRTRHNVRRCGTPIDYRGERFEHHNALNPDRKSAHVNYSKGTKGLPVQSLVRGTGHPALVMRY